MKEPQVGRGHGRVVCSKCGVVIITCRCMGAIHNIQYQLCPDCRKPPEVVKPTKTYCIHPGYVKSKHDGETHYIGYGQLVKLYRVDGKECGLYMTLLQRHAAKICLYPDETGAYVLPNAGHTP